MSNCADSNAANAPAFMTASLLSDPLLHRAFTVPDLANHIASKQAWRRANWNTLGPRFLRAYSQPATSLVSADLPISLRALLQMQLSDLPRCIPRTIVVIGQPIQEVG
jgi:hypothetical protein